jgi:hypothetical protein
MNGGRLAPNYPNLGRSRSVCFWHNFLGYLRETAKLWFAFWSAPPEQKMKYFIVALAFFALFLYVTLKSFQGKYN